MSKLYNQLSLEDRCEIARRLGEGQSKRQIAANLGSHEEFAVRTADHNGGPIGPHRSTLASCTRKAHSWPKLIPMWAANSGINEVGVMPGCVLVSRKISWSMASSQR